MQIAAKIPTIMTDINDPENSTKSVAPGATLTYFNDGGGGDPSDFLGSEILAKGDFFWVYERRRDFFGSRKKRRDLFWVAKKRTKGFWGVC